METDQILLLVLLSSVVQRQKSSPEGNFVFFIIPSTDSNMISSVFIFAAKNGSAKWIERKVFSANSDMDVRERKIVFSFQEPLTFFINLNLSLWEWSLQNVSCTPCLPQISVFSYLYLLQHVLQLYKELLGIFSFVRNAIQSLRELTLRETEAGNSFRILKSHIV